jgi:hypothetical protein
LEMRFLSEFWVALLIFITILGGSTANWFRL